MINFKFTVRAFLAEVGVFPLKPSSIPCPSNDLSLSQQMVLQRTLYIIVFPENYLISGIKENLFGYIQ